MLTHVDSKNNPTMVDVSGKTATQREATAQSIVYLPSEIMKLMDAGEIKGPKGPVFQTAIISGTMAVKNTSSMIPFCHPLPIESCKIEIKPINENEVSIQCRVKVFHKTGVEMEALTGASVAALTIYDMCKAMSHDISIKHTSLLSKSGGKSDYVNKN